jgi:hypothetical protein
LIHLPVQPGQGDEGGEVVRRQGAGALQHGDGLAPVVVLVDPLGEEAQEAGVGGGGGAAEGGLGGGTVAEAQQGQAELEQGAVAWRLLIRQGRQGVDGAGGVAPLEAPEAQPVAGFAGDRLEGFGLGEGCGEGCGAGGRLAVGEAGGVEPAEPVARAGGEPGLQLLGPALGVRCLGVLQPVVGLGGAGAAGGQGLAGGGGLWGRGLQAPPLAGGIGRLGGKTGCGVGPLQGAPGGGRQGVGAQGGPGTVDRFCRRGWVQGRPEVVTLLCTRSWWKPRFQTL